MKRLYGVSLALAIAIGGISAASVAAAQPPGPPARLAQRTAGGAVIPFGGWSRTSEVRFSMKASGDGGWLRPQVEVAGAGQAFAGKPTATGRAMRVASGTSARLSATVTGLHEGGYDWQARLIDSHNQTSPWVTAGTAGQTDAFAVDTSAPSRPFIRSSTNPKWGGWYRTTVETFSWSSKDSGSGIAGYSWALGHHLHSARPALGHSTSVTFKHVGDGRWVLHVWSRDAAGNWSRLGYFRFNIERRAPYLWYRSVSTSHFNPYSGPERWTFKLNRGAYVRAEVFRSGQKSPVVVRKLGWLKRGRNHFVWHGRDGHRKMVKHGWYWIRLYTLDKIGNRGDFPSAGIWVWPFKPKLPFVPEPGHHIVVSLSRQALYAYNGSKLVWQSLVTTGNPALPTPTGHFTIFAKFHPFEFVSPWPPSSPYYYPPSWVSYAMEFQNQGYFIHDAPWRTHFGPGSNGPGKPGTNYGGTHGCVNTPLKTAHFLFSWAPIGTPVDIVK